MEAFWPRQPNDAQSGPRIPQPSTDAHTLTDLELDQRIRGGWDIWCELLDDLLSTGGMLPSRDLARRVAGFFENDYWRAEDARVEALRRHIASQTLRRCRVTDQSRGIR
jgi:hypothetical protein